MNITTCEKCGSVYKLTSVNVPMRDKDTIECDICGETIHSWNQAKVWSATLIEKNENHLK